MQIPEPIKLVYRILNWGSLVILVFVLVLVFRKSAPPQVVNDPAAAARVEQKFAAADQTRATGAPAHVQLDATELNSYLNQNLQLALPPQPAPAAGAAVNSSATAQTSSPSTGTQISGAQPALEEVQSSVKDVKIDMEGDLVKAYVIFDFHGQDLSLELDGHLNSQDGYLNFVPVAGKLGSLPLPQSALDGAVAKLMDSPENREKLKLPADISDVHIEDGQAMVTYK